MTKIFVLAVFGSALFLQHATAVRTHQLLSYQENYPKSPHWYEFSLDAHCNDGAAPIQLRDFTSEKKYADKKVRMVHIYVSANNKNCKDLVRAVRTEKFNIPVDPKKTTHVYVTYDADLKMTSGH